eukprot:scaffold1170_cov122-Cylindrotheca_fusiformis.AAC.8
MTRLDFESFWPCFKSVIQAQETYAFDPNMTLEEAYRLWCELPLKTFAFVDGDEHILASYYMKPNGMGPGDHICNCGYMVDAKAQGRGIARQLCEHSQRIAKELGFKAMQFNAVVSTNVVAVALWKKLGFITSSVRFHWAIVMASLGMWIATSCISRYYCKTCSFLSEKK